MAVSVAASGDRQRWTTNNSPGSCWRRSEAQAGGGPDDIQPDTPLGSNGLGIDSIGCLDLVLELERQTGIRLRDETLTAESLATPAA